MKTIAVFFGGRSTEHDVSIITALASIIKPLQLSKQYHVIPVYIARNGAWFGDEQLTNITLFSSGKIKDYIERSKPIGVSFDGGLTLLKPGGLSGLKRIKVDVAFPAMHGTYGEDGSLMGLLDMAGVPYVGCGQAASVLAMDKVLAKLMAQAHNIATPKFLYFNRTEIIADTGSIAKACQKELKFPLFVKPAHLGSSIGISRAGNATELHNAIEVAAHYDDIILVEEAVHNLIEVTLPILGNDSPRPALLERPLTSAEDFFDFDTKYLRGGKKGGKKGGVKGAQGYSQLPAELPKDLYEQAEHTGLAVYKALGCSGTARVDMLIDSKTETVYFNEVNPLPGDLYAHNWRTAGVSGVALVTRLIELAEERHAARQQQEVAFETNYLKQF
ncbi:MAG TPA: D-alanine--D-alanine ligase [Candidatus Limnocylindrales bacterium]|nr:D-alanine--D-alanine ligase [Candidatus Limnocylindrales bacterium]